MSEYLRLLEAGQQVRPFAFTFLILMFVILFAGPILLLVLHTRYRERFAPLRVPAWL